MKHGKINENHGKNIENYWKTNEHMEKSMKTMEKPWKNQWKPWKKHWKLWKNQWTHGKINENHGKTMEKSMKTIEKTLKTMEKSMKTIDRWTSMKSACFSSKTQPIARKSAPDRQNQWKLTKIIGNQGKMKIRNLHGKKKNAPIYNTPWEAPSTSRNEGRGCSGHQAFRWERAKSKANSRQLSRCHGMPWDAPGHMTVLQNGGPKPQVNYSKLRPEAVVATMDNAKLNLN